jgi:hypothetical protein
MWPEPLMRLRDFNRYAHTWNVAQQRQGDVCSGPLNTKGLPTRHALMNRSHEQPVRNAAAAGGNCSALSRCS